MIVAAMRTEIQANNISRCLMVQKGYKSNYMTRMTDTILIPAWVDGTLTPVKKLDAHLRGLRHKAVSIFVMNSGRILIQQRAFHKYHTPGLWANTCCTHPAWNEAAETCAARRLNEELGIKNLDCIHRAQLEYRADVGGNMIEHEVVDVFVADAPDDMNIAPNPDEVHNVRWVTPAALQRELKQTPRLFTPWLHIYMTEHFDRIIVSK